MDDNAPIALDDIDFKRVAEELADATMPPLRRPGDVTVSDYIAAVKRTRGVTLTYRQGSYRLDCEVNAGRLTKLRVWDDVAKCTCNIYRRVEPDEPDPNDDDTEL